MTLGENRVTISVASPDGAPVSDADVTVDAEMPAHGHGAPESPTVTPKGPGEYEATLTLHMPGRWVITVEAAAGELVGTSVTELSL